MNRIALFSYVIIAIYFPAAQCSKNDFFNSPPQGIPDSAHCVARPNMRRCISLSAEMTHEADVGGDDASHHASIYCPVHTPAHMKLRKDRWANSESSSPRNPSERQSTVTGFGSQHHEHEEYTQLQTQLFPLIRF